ncbi:MAG TPA: outer membrane protein assembly factor BamA [Candidatus Babeliales bacterium]|nr:outer membrane protein assembly factor BamA [Candidatus Babeliales bacterium]
MYFLHTTFKKNSLLTVLIFFGFSYANSIYSGNAELPYEDAVDNEKNSFNGWYISAINLVGNTHVPDDAILDRIPYRIGERFDQSKTGKLIKTLYFDLKRFRNISVYVKDSGTNTIILTIVFEEKPLIQDIVITGNKQVTEKEIREKIPFADIRALDEQELKGYELSIKKIYEEKGFHNTTITSNLSITEQQKAIVTFTVVEHKKTVVTRINFEGNHIISGKKLRSIMFTHEDWLLGFMDKSGTFQYDRIEGDKQMIKQFYQNNGFISAQVVDVKIKFDEQCNTAHLTYIIEEGDCYTISSVTARGNDILKDDYLTSILPTQPNEKYSRENIVNSIKALEFIWGDMGYIYAQIDPEIIPDETTKTVAVTFHSDIGNPVYLNKLTIKGNWNTQDKIIRRRLGLNEGSLITNRAMEISKNRVEALGYFDKRDGVNWKTTRLDENNADLDLIIKEGKTGTANFQLGFGGAAKSSSPTGSVSAELNVANSNFKGSGVRFDLTARFGAEEKAAVFNITQPWLFDRPILGAIDIYHKRLGYEELEQSPARTEKLTGVTLTTGLVTGGWHHLFADTFLRFSFGVENVQYENKNTEGKKSSSPVQSNLRTDNAVEQEFARKQYDRIFNKLFTTGTFGTFMTQIGKDAKNHPMHPTRGYSWLARSILVLPNQDIGYHKFDLDVNWLTPIIGDFDLIFRFHAKMGIINLFGNKSIPYRELFHIGGPDTVRGFLWGQIGPQFTTTSSGRRATDSVGGRKAFVVNAELIFPITNDFTMKGVVFYDGGAGWDNPYVNAENSIFIKNNNFRYRHAVGVGVRLLNPMPIRVDWGFKLDPRKGETAHEVHFNMSYDW